MARGLEHMRFCQRRRALVEFVVHLPEASLPGGRLGGPGRELRARVGAFIREMAEHIGKAIAHGVLQPFDDVSQPSAIGAEIVAPDQQGSRVAALRAADMVAVGVDGPLKRELGAAGGQSDPPYLRTNRSLDKPSDPARNRSHLGRRILAQIEEDLVHIAPSPALGRIIALDDRMAGGVEMRGGVAVRRLVAAPHVTAGAAEPQVHPGGADGEALLATPARWG